MNLELEADLCVTLRRGKRNDGGVTGMGSLGARAERRATGEAYRSLSVSASSIRIGVHWPAEDVYDGQRRR